jgi:integrase
MKFLEPKELQRLLECARRRSARDWAILLLAYRHGLRAIELSTLKVSDVDLKANVIRVARAKGSLETVQPIDGAVGGQSWLNDRKALRLWLAERESYGDASDFCSSRKRAVSLRLMRCGVCSRRLRLKRVSMAGLFTA